jgi:hypothetical protein
MTTVRAESAAAREDGSEPSPRASLVRKVAITACVGVVLAVYLRSALSYEKSLDPEPHGTGPVSADGRPSPEPDFHNLIADALVRGQAHLTVEPPRELLRLKDPYDPNANAQSVVGQRLIDLSLYKGKLYAYFGPAPAILLFIPFRLLRVGDLSPTLAGLVFSVSGFAFSVLLFKKLARYFFGKIPLWMECFSILALGLAVPVPYVIYVGRGYEVAIACGYFLLFAGLYCLASGLLSRELRGTALLALGSAALAAAVAARPNLIFAALFVALAVYIVSRNLQNESRDRGVRIAALVGPYVIIGILIALYNVIRFDSVTEFGSGYQLARYNPREYAFYQLWYIPHGLYYYLVAPVRLLGNYPYVYLLKFVPYSQAQSNDVYAIEPVAGVLTNIPLAALGLVMVVTQFRGLARRCRPALFAIVSGLVVAAGIVVGTSFTFRGATMRYTLDFAPLLLVSGLLAWAFWSTGRAPRGARFWFVQGIWVLALAASVLFNLAITLTPCPGCRGLT